MCPIIILNCVHDYCRFGPFPHQHLIIISIASQPPPSLWSPFSVSLSELNATIPIIKLFANVVHCIVPYTHSSQPYRKTPAWTSSSPPTQTPTFIISFNTITPRTVKPENWAEIKFNFTQNNTTTNNNIIHSS